MVTRMSDNENLFTDQVKKFLTENFNGKYTVAKKSETGANLRYGLIFDETGALSPKKRGDVPTALDGMRGSYAFQADIVVHNGRVPLVVVELKYSKYSTDQIIAYSARAQRYRELYPYIRSGFVVGNKKALGNKFFRHNRGFDFALALPDENLQPLVEVVSRQLELAEAGLNVLVKRPVRCWENGALPVWAESSDGDDED